MTAPTFRIEVEITNPVTEHGSPMFEYPDISDSEEAELEWSVTGRFKMVGPSGPLTVGWDKTPGWIDEYVWKRIAAFHWQFEAAVNGEATEDFILDNPGTIRFEPDGDSIRLVFEYSEDGDQQERAASVPTRVVGEAVIAATRDLRAKLLKANQQPRETRLVSDLDDLIAETRARLG